jgi:hypothetical protein
MRFYFLLPVFKKWFSRKLTGGFQKAAETYINLFLKQKLHVDVTGSHSTVEHITTNDAATNQTCMRKGFVHM